MAPMTPPTDDAPGRRSWIERFVWRHLDGCAGLATFMALLAVTFILTGLLWLFVAYGKVFSVSASTEIMVMDVSKGAALQWPLGGGRAACDDSNPVALAEGTLLQLSHPLKVIVRVEPAVEPGSEAMIVFQFEHADAAEAPSSLALLDSPTGPGRAIPASVVCLGERALGAGRSLPLRGRLELGADVTPARSHLLQEGEALLQEAPAGPFAWMLDRLQGSYQFDSDRAALRLGDKVLLPSEGGCSPNQADCLETQGFLRLAHAPEGSPLLLRARVVSTSDEVEIVRPSQQITRLRSSIVRRFTNDPWVAGILSLGLVCGGFAWLLIELMNLLRASPPARSVAVPVAADKPDEEGKS